MLFTFHGLTWGSNNIRNLRAFIMQTLRNLRFPNRLGFMSFIISVNAHPNSFIVTDKKDSLNFFSDFSNAIQPCLRPELK